MRQTRKFMVVIMAALLLVSSTVAWAAEELYKGYRVVRVLVNGAEVRSPVPAISFEGTTLVPLRAIAEALGADVEWDGDTYTAEITTQASSGSSEITALQQENQSLKTQLASAQDELKTVKAELEAVKEELSEVTRSLDEANKKLYPPISEKGLGRSNPMPTGQPLTAALVQNDLEFTARFTLTEVIRGDQAWQRIKEANRFNDPPEPGHEYVLVKMKYELLAISDPEAAVEFSDFWFTAVSGSGRDYPRVSVVEPEPAFGTMLYRGASHEGYLVFAVAEGDSAPLLTFARDRQGKRGYWMEMQPLEGTDSSSPSSDTADSDEGSAESSPRTSVTVPKVTVPSHVNTPAALATYLNNNYGTVDTPAGTLTLNYDIHVNDRTYFPYDIWIQIEYEPTLYFVDLATKIDISEADKEASIKILRQHAATVYAVAATALPGKKILGHYFDSWYRYPTIQAGLEVRRYLSWQNYDDNFSVSGDPYTNAELTEFHFEPKWDSIQF